MKTKTFFLTLMAIIFTVTAAQASPWWNPTKTKFNGNAVQNTNANSNAGHLKFDSENFYKKGSGAQAFANEGAKAKYSGKKGAGIATVKGTSCTRAHRVHNGYLATSMTKNAGMVAITPGCGNKASLKDQGEAGTFAAQQNRRNGAIASSTGKFKYSGNVRHGGTVIGAGVTCGWSKVKTTGHSAYSASGQTVASGVHAASPCSGGSI